MAISTPFIPFLPPFIAIFPPSMSPSLPRFALHLDDGLRRLVDPADIYYLEADGDDTWVRFRSTRRLRDRRPLGELAERLAPWHVVRIHRSFAVSLLHIRDIRHRGGSDDWEVKLEPPVNKVLPVGPSYVAGLWETLGEG